MLDDRELIPAQPGDRVARRDECAQPVGGRAYHLIAGQMAVDVVDLLEPVEVDHQHRRRAAAPAGIGEHRGQPVGEHRAVRQVGQRVVFGKVTDMLLGLLAVAQVDHRRHPGPLAAIQHLAGTHLHRDAGPVGMDDVQLIGAAFLLGQLFAHPFAVFLGKMAEHVGALELVERAPHQLFQRMVAIDDTPSHRDDDRLECRVGERGEPFGFLLGPQQVRLASAGELLVLDRVHQPVEQLRHPLRLVARFHGQAHAEIGAPFDQPADGILHVADAQPRAVLGLVEPADLALPVDPQRNHALQGEEEDKPEPEGEDEVEGRTARLHRELREPVARRQVADRSQQGKAERADDAGNAVHADGADRIVDAQLLLQHRNADNGGQPAGQPDGQRSRCIEHHAAGRHRNQPAQHAGKCLLRQQHALARPGDEIAAAGAGSRRQNGVGDDMGDVG